ncbi:MAG: hypothetical protein QXO51_03430 [Halobacteria archaeon]
MSAESGRLRVVLKALGMKEAEVDSTLKLIEKSPAEALAKLRAILKPVAPDMVEFLERMAKGGPPGGPTLRMPVDPDFGFEAARQLVSPGQGYLLVEKKPGLARKLLKAYTSAGGQEGIILDFAGGLALRGPKVSVVRPLKEPSDVLEALRAFLEEHRKSVVLAEIQGAGDLPVLEHAFDITGPQEAVLLIQAEPGALPDDARARLRRRFWTVAASTQKIEGKRRPVLMVSLTRPAA